jgi:hypothetical protein
MKKFTMPLISPENMAPEMEEFVAFAKELTNDANALYEEGVALRKELALLNKAKKAKKRASGSRK